MRKRWIVLGLLVALTVVSHALDINARPQESLAAWKQAGDEAFAAQDYLEAIRRYRGTFAMEEPTEERAAARAWLAARIARALMRESVKAATEEGGRNIDWARYRLRDARLWVRTAEQAHEASIYPVLADLSRVLATHPESSLQDIAAARDTAQRFDQLRRQHGTAATETRDAEIAAELGQLLDRDD